MEILEQRDTKGLYRKAVDGKLKDVVGVDIPFPKPTASNLILNKWDESTTIERTVDKILSEIPHF